MNRKKTLKKGRHLFYWGKFAGTDVAPEDGACKSLVTTKEQYSL